MVEAYFAWLGKFDPITGGAIFIASLVLVLVILLVILRAFTVGLQESEKKKNLLYYILRFFGKQDVVESTKPKEGVVEAEEDSVEISRVTDSKELVVLILKIIRFKDRESAIDKDWMSTSMKYVETIMSVNFSDTLKRLLYDANPTYYNSNKLVLNLITEALIDELKDAFKLVIKENHLHRHTNPILKKEYIVLKANEFTRGVSEKICAVLQSVSGSNGCVDFDLPEEVTNSIKNLFDSIFTKLIDLAIEREFLKRKERNDLVTRLEKEDDLSPSTIDMIKSVMHIEFTELDKRSEN